MKGLGSRLRQRLLDLGLEQKAFADLIGINRRTLSDYLSEQSRPGAEVLARMALHGIDIYWLVTGRRSASLILGEGDSRFDIRGFLAEDTEVARALFDTTEDYTINTIINYLESKNSNIKFDRDELKSIIKTLHPKHVWLTIFIWSNQLEQHSGKLREIRKNGTDAELLSELAMLMAGLKFPEDPASEAEAWANSRDPNG